MPMLTRDQIVSHLVDQGHTRDEVESCDRTDTLPQSWHVGRNDAMDLSGPRDARALLHFHGPEHRETFYMGGVACYIADR